MENSNKNEIILTRMKSAMKSLGLNKSKVAEITGYSKGQTGWILEGKVPLSEKFLRIFCSELNISEQWVRTGEGDMNKVASETETLDPSLARAIIAERQDRYGSTEPMTLTTTEAEIIELLRDLPKDARLDEYDNIRALWLSLCRGKNPPA